MTVRGLHHYTLRCTPAELEPLREFYTRHIGLTVGARPPIPAPGYWLYAEGEPVVHLYAYLDREDRPLDGPPTGPLDHISFRGQGLDATRDHLRAHGVAFDEAPVPEWPLHQVFLRDPKGLKIELTFWREEEAAAAARSATATEHGHA